MLGIMGAFLYIHTSLRGHKTGLHALLPNPDNPAPRSRKDFSMDKFGFKGWVMRFGAALVIVLATFNPTGYSYYHLVGPTFPHFTPLAAVLGILLIIGWIVYMHATLRSIGRVGVLIGFALFGAFIWLIHSWGLNFTGGAFVWIVLIVLAAVLAVGMSWSHLYQRWSGQVEVDELNK
jgi:Family of unknown function (DUF6524)